MVDRAAGKHAWCHTTDAFSLRNIIEGGELSPDSWFSYGKPAFRKDRGGATTTSARAPIVVMLSSDLVRTRDPRLAMEHRSERPIAFSWPKVRSLIVPRQLGSSSFLSSFLKGPGRNVNVRWFDLSPLKLAGDYQALLEHIALEESQSAVETGAEDLSEVTFLRSELSKKLIELIAQDPRSLQGIEWRELEHLMAEAFERLGFLVELTPGSKDRGKDLVLTCRGTCSRLTYYVEIKHWRSGKRVGQKAVREFLNIVVRDDISAGLYLSTSGYGANVIESFTEIERKRLLFGTESKVVSMSKTYVRANAGLWTPEGPVQILCGDTF